VGFFFPFYYWKADTVDFPRYLEAASVSTKGIISLTAPTVMVTATAGSGNGSSDTDDDDGQLQYQHQ
jgi:hypothetical protein